MAPKPPPPGAKTTTGFGSTLKKYLSNPFKKKEAPKTPVGGCGERLSNALNNNYRGLIGALVPLAVLSWQSEHDNHAKTVELMWMWIFWFYLLQPVAVPCVGLIPVFLLPMTGTMPTSETCACYMNDNIILFILTAMLIVLLNNSGVDRRIALWFICSGDACQYSAKKLIFKVSTASFFLSMFSSRLITTSMITQIMTASLTKLDSTTPKDDDNPNFISLRNVINNAIQTASAIGSTAILHSAFVTLLFRGCFVEFAPKGKEFPDIFNYLQYSAFAFPVAFLMFLFNLTYHSFLIDWVVCKNMSLATMGELRTILSKLKDDIPRRVSLHERLTVIFALFYLLMFFFRWNQWVDGWADFRRDDASPEIPKIKDATTAAIFLILLHILPKGYGFLNFIDAEKKSELPPLKPESAILWWRFVDRNVNYGYIFTFGCAFALVRSAMVTGLDRIIAENSGLIFTEQPWNTGLFLIIFITALLANVMSSLAACGTFLPFVLCMSLDAPLPWPGKVYVAALGVGITSSFGFCLPFQYTPAYFCHHTGKVPIMKMIKYSFLPVWICLLSVYVALLIWAPFLFDPEDYGIAALDAGIIITTTTS